MHAQGVPGEPSRTSPGAAARITHWENTIVSKRRPLALGAAAAIGLGSLSVAAPAIAEETEAPTANLGTTAQAFADAAVIENTTGIDDVALGAAVTTAGESVVFVD